MNDLRLKSAVLALLTLSLIQGVYGWAPGECQASGRTAVRCCEHEAYWCHGGNARARNHCHYCQEQCIKVASESVCVWGGTWPARRKKCYAGVEWFKACAAIPNDASLGGGAYEHVERSIIVSSSEASPQGKTETFPVDLGVLERATTQMASIAKGPRKLSAVVRPQRNPVANQIAFVISLMGEVLSALRSTLVSNTVAAARNNMSRAVSSLGQLVTQGRELINMFPSTDRGLARTVLNKWISAIRVTKVTLEGFIADGATLPVLNESAQAIIDELKRGFWTKAEVALNAYAAFGRFTEDWAPWINAIATYFQN